VIFLKSSMAMKPK